MIAISQKEREGGGRMGLWLQMAEGELKFWVNFDLLKFLNNYVKICHSELMQDSWNVMVL